MSCTRALVSRLVLHHSHSPSLRLCRRKGREGLVGMATLYEANNEEGSCSGFRHGLGILCILFRYSGTAICRARCLTREVSFLGRVDWGAELGPLHQELVPRHEAISLHPIQSGPLQVYIETVQAVGLSGETGCWVACL